MLCWSVEFVSVCLSYTIVRTFNFLPLWKFCMFCIVAILCLGTQFNLIDVQSANYNNNHSKTKSKSKSNRPEVCLATSELSNTFEARTASILGTSFLPAWLDLRLIFPMSCPNHLWRRFSITMPTMLKGINWNYKGWFLMLPRQLILPKNKTYNSSVSTVVPSIFHRCRRCWAIVRSIREIQRHYRKILLIVVFRPLTSRLHIGIHAPEQHVRFKLIAR